MKLFYIILSLVVISHAGAYGDSLDAVSYLNQAVDYYEINNFRQAEAMFLKALESDPGLVEARQSLGILYYAEGKTEQAMDEWSQALESANYHDRARLYLFMGIAVMFAPGLIDSTGDFTEQVISYFDCSLQIDSEFVEAHYWRARAWELLPNIDSAIAWYEKTTKIDPKYAPAYNSWGLLLYVHSEKGRGAIEKFRKAIFLEEEQHNRPLSTANAVYHYNLAAAYFKAGHLGDGLAETAKARRIFPDIQTVQDKMSRVIRVGE